MKRYSLEERINFSKVIVGARDLVRHSDAFLAELGQVHRGNVTAFNRQKRPHALSTRTIDQLLEHYGFTYDTHTGFSPANGEYCPRITLRTDFDSEFESLKSFIDLLGASKPFTLCPINNQSGDFALLWDYKDSPEISGWCAVALGLGADNSALEQLNGVARGTAFKVDDEMYRAWRATAPRKSEVLNAYDRAVRQVASDALAKKIDRAFTDPGGASGQGTSVGPSL